MLHPIVAQLNPSPEQEPAIARRGTDVAATAGAGTGKTRTLVARYLSLLAEGLPLRSVVAITFTRKAAREMRNRVREEVRTYLNRTDLAPAERDDWQERYTALDAARIGTIYSLCTEILRAHPAEACVDPRFDVLEESQANILLSRAVDEALGWAADDDEAVALFGLLGERLLRGVLETLVGEHREAGEGANLSPEDILGRWEATLEERQSSALTALLAGRDWVDAVETLAANEASDAADRAELQRVAALAAARGAVGTVPERLASLTRLDSISLGGGKKALWPGGADQLAEVKGALRTLRGLWRGNLDLLGLTLTPLDEQLATAVSKLPHVLDFLARRYSVLKDERNALDFDDLEQGALALLEGNSQVRMHWERDVRAILVDEFQDTNGRQRDLVAYLNGSESKLFIVGDAKQSIYGFRGADVTVFRQERERIERRGTAYHLRTSYRAHRELIQGLNDLMLPVLGEEADPARPWAEPLEPLLHDREVAGSGFVSPHIEVHLAIGTKSGGGLDRAADAVVARILDLRSGGLGYGDVAILCRASTSFGSHEDALERAGVPFLTVAGRGFFGRPEIRDLLNAIRAIADPTDDLALVGLLRSPVAALSDGALYQLRTMRNRDEGAPPLWEVLRNAGHELDGPDAPRAARAAALVSELHGQVGRLPVADVLKSLLDETDYRAALIGAGQTRAARNVAKLLADAHASGIVGLGEFLEYIDGMRASGAREGEARATAEGVVQIMTVHAAKGLEFPLVIIGDATREGRGVGGVLVDADLGVLVPTKDEANNLPAIYRLGKARAADQGAAESDRLFYVAATRAREKLILSACINLNKDQTVGRVDGWLGRIAGPIGLKGARIDCREGGSETIRLPLHVGNTPILCAVYESGVAWDELAPKPEPRAGVRPTLPPPLLATLTSGSERADERTSLQDRIPPRRVWRVVPIVAGPGAPAWVIGSLVHAALAAWRFPDDTFAGWAQARARGYGITDARQLADAVNESRRLLERFSRHPLAAAMGGAARRLHEIPYSLTVDGWFERGIIDAMYLRDGLWTIVEFKTDRVRSEADLEAMLDGQDYVAQAQRYATAVETLVHERPRSILCMLNYQGTVHLHEVE